MLEYYSIIDILINNVKKRSKTTSTVISIVVIMACFEVLTLLLASGELVSSLSLSQRRMSKHCSDLI